MQGQLALLRVCADLAAKVETCRQADGSSAETQMWQVGSDNLQLLANPGLARTAGCVSCHAWSHRCRLRQTGGSTACLRTAAQAHDSKAKLQSRRSPGMEHSLSRPDLLLCHPPSEWIRPVSDPALVCTPCIRHQLWPLPWKQSTGPARDTTVAQGHLRACRTLTTPDHTEVAHSTRVP